MDPFTITKAYQQNIANDPRKEIPLLAGGLGLGTYLAARPLLAALSQAAGAFGGPAVQQAVESYTAPGGDIEVGRRRLALLAALAGAGYGVLKHIDYKGGLQGMKSSLTKPDYWKQNPDRRAAYKTVEDTRTDLEKATSMDKVAWGYDQGFLSDYHVQDIPLHKSIDLVKQDPYLLRENRNKVVDIIANSSDDKFTSKSNLTNTAIRAGADFSTAYLFGTGLGRVLALPDPLVGRVAAMGGVSAAVIGSGVLNKI